MSRSETASCKSPIIKQPAARLFVLVTPLLIVSGLSVVPAVSSADMVLSATTAAVQSDAPFELRLTITNPTSQPFTVQLPSPVHATLETPSMTATLELTAESQDTGPLLLAPGSFRTVLLHGRLPVDATGPITLTATGLEANPVLLMAQAAPADSTPASTTTAHVESPAPELTPRPPSLALSVYEPVYFIVGGDGGLNAKFQLSFKYRLFDNKGRLARKLPWIDDLYFSYSQTSLWDLGDLSKPFRDSSYRPRFFYGNYDLAHAGDGLWHFGFETGLGHESNGKDGLESRSINIAYLRPTVTFGNVEGKHLYIAPLIYAYLDKSENPDIDQYRGNVDLLVGYGSKGSWNFWTTLRKGTRRFGSAEVNVSYPLSRLSDGELSGWLLLQFFDGYGESLLDYQHKLPAQWRLGLAVAL